MVPLALKQGQAEEKSAFSTTDGRGTKMCAGWFDNLMPTVIKIILPFIYHVQKESHRFDKLINS